ncbi:MAG: hypothetical protein IJ550_02170 [Bacteroidaceae bacterium]|nr:hypothetical protein [Bacteroidaceae bacterium]
MSQAYNGTTLLSLIGQMRECWKKQRVFREQKNTPNYRAMLASEENLDNLLTKVRRNVADNMKERNIEVLP